MSRNLPWPPTGETQQRICDDPGSFLRNYENSIGEEESLRKAIDKDIREECLFVAFALEQLYAEYPKVLLNNSGRGIKDL